MRTDSDHLARVRDPTIEPLHSHKRHVDRRMAQPTRGPLDNSLSASARSDQRRGGSIGSDRSAKLTAIDIALLSRSPAHAPKVVALLERYLRLPDAWPRGAPAVLPPAFQALLTSFPGEACPQAARCS
jgi:hypothetical protein